MPLTKTDIQLLLLCTQGNRVCEHFISSLAIARNSKSLLDVYEFFTNYSYDQISYISYIIDNMDLFISSDQFIFREEDKLESTTPDV